MMTMTFYAKAKNALNRSRLCRQIVRCNALVNKDKSDYYSKLMSDNSHDSRPVFGLSFISKLVECVVAKQLLEHIHVHNLDNPYQSAYKAGHSTETALLYIKK